MVYILILEKTITSLFVRRNAVPGYAKFSTIYSAESLNALSKRPGVHWEDNPFLLPCSNSPGQPPALQTQTLWSTPGPGPLLYRSQQTRLLLENHIYVQATQLWRSRFCYWGWFPCGCCSVSSAASLGLVRGLRTHGAAWETAVTYPALLVWGTASMGVLHLNNWK